MRQIEQLGTGPGDEGEKKVTPREKVASLLEYEPAGSPVIQGFADFAGKMFAEMDRTREEFRLTTPVAVTDADKEAIQKRAAAIDETIRVRKSGPDADAYLTGFETAETVVFPLYEDAEIKKQYSAGFHNKTDRPTFFMWSSYKAAEHFQEDVFAINRAKSKPAAGKTIQK